MVNVRKKRNTENGDRGTTTPSYRSYEDVAEEIGLVRSHVHLILLVGVAMACDAMEILLLCFIQKCIAIEWDLSHQYQSVLTASVFLGQIIGMVLLCPLADTFGRRIVVLIGWVIVSISGVLSSIAPNIIALILLRLMVGVGIGASQSPIYDIVFETLPASQRGKIIFTNMFIAAGEMYVIGVASFSLEAQGWRYLTFCSVVPTILLTIYGVFALPESPLWLLQQNREAEARGQLERIAAAEDIILSPFRLKSIPKEDGAGIPTDGHVMELFAPRFAAVSYTLWIVWALSNFVRFCSILMATVFYADARGCGYQYEDMMFTSSAQITGIAVALFSIDFMGRSLTQAVSYLLAALFTCIYLILFDSTAVNLMTMFIVMAARSSIEGGLAALWNQTPELYPTELRSTGHGVACFMGRIGAFLAVFWMDLIAYKNLFIGSGVFIFASIVMASFALRLPNSLADYTAEARGVSKSEYKATAEEETTRLLGKI